MTLEELQAILTKHSLWLATEGTGGEAANLSNVDLSALDETEKIRIADSPFPYTIQVQNGDLAVSSVSVVETATSNPVSIVLTAPSLANEINLDYVSGLITATSLAAGVELTVDYKHYLVPPVTQNKNIIVADTAQPYSVQLRHSQLKNLDVTRVDTSGSLSVSGSLPTSAAEVFADLTKGVITCFSDLAGVSISASYQYYTSLTSSSESLAVPLASPFSASLSNLYVVDSSLNLVITDLSQTMTKVNTTPSAIQEFQFDNTTSTITFSSLASGLNISSSYNYFASLNSLTDTLIVPNGSLPYVVQLPLTNLVRNQAIITRNDTGSRLNPTLNEPTATNDVLIDYELGSLRFNSALAGKSVTASVSFYADLTVGSALESLIIPNSPNPYTVQLHRQNINSADLKVTRADTNALLTVVSGSPATVNEIQLDSTTGLLTALGQLRGLQLITAYRYLAPNVLQGSMLSGANLGQANLSGLDLSGADFSHAKMRATKMVGSTLDGANLSHAVMTGADLTSAAITNADLTDCVLTSAKLYASNLTGSDLTNADMSNGKMPYATLTSAKLYYANMNTTNLTNAILTDAKFFQADYATAEFYGATNPPPVKT